MRLQELMPVAMSANSLPMEAAKLLEFDLNCSLIEVESQVETWMSLIQSLPEKRRPNDIAAAILLGKENFKPSSCDNPPPSVWNDPSVQCYG